MSEQQHSLTTAEQEAVLRLIEIPPAAEQLSERFAEHGYELYLVGGSVRDAVLGRAAFDLDFCTNAHPEEILRIVDGWAHATWTTGIQFGTVGIARDGWQLEITTFRADSYDRVSRNPEVRFGDNVRDDLVRRDFSVNAMAVSLPDRRFVDPFHGVRDLAAGQLRTPGTPEESFLDDPLRILRAARFVSQLGFSVSEDVLVAMRELAGEMKRITAERIRDELVKLLLGEHPVRALRLLVETGVAEYVLPELPALQLSIDEHHQHKDVYEHTLTVLQQAIDLEDGEPDLVLRLAAVLHDIGKPATRRFETGGRVSFHHHDVVGAKMARKRMRALCFPKDIITPVSHLIFLHLRFYGYRRGEWSDSAVRRYVTDAGAELERLHKLVRSDCTTRSKRRATALARAYDELEKRIEVLKENEDLARVRPDLNGNEIMEILGLAPGPEVGQAWQYLKDLRLEHGPLEREEAITQLRAWWVERGK